MKYFIFTICVIIHGTVAAGMMTGGWSPVTTDVNSTEFQKCANFAAEKISSASNSLFHMRYQEVLSAQKQIVSGVNYKFKVRMGPTECKKNVQYSEEDLHQCPFLPCETTHICDAVVWYKPWVNEEPMKLTKYTCEDEPKTC